MNISKVFNRLFRRKVSEIVRSNPNMFTAYIIPNSEIADYHKDNHAFRSRSDILRTGIPFCPSAEEALKLATESIEKDNIADLTKHTVFIEIGIGLPWAK